MQVIHKPKPDPKLMTQTELLAYIHELEEENKRLEESFQKATGAEQLTHCRHSQRCARSARCAVRLSARSASISIWQNIAAASTTAQTTGNSEEISNERLRRKT